MAARYRMRPLKAGSYGVFYSLDGSGESYPGQLDKEPEAEYAEIQDFEFTQDKSAGGLFAKLRQLTQNPQDRDFFRCDVGDSETTGILRRDCGVSDSHVTGSWGRKGDYDLFGGPRMSAFLPSLPGYTFVASFVKDALTEAGFSGMCFTEWQLNVAQTKFSPGQVYLLDATGENCVRTGEIVDGPNSCGWCGYEPAICLVCGWMSHDCPSCGKQLFAQHHCHGGPSDSRILIEPTERHSDLLQIDAAKWQGEDFINLYGICIVTRRVIDWLRRHHAGSWIAYPVQCELAEVTDESIPHLLSAAGSRKSDVQVALKKRNGIRQTDRSISVVANPG